MQQDSLLPTVLEEWLAVFLHRSLRDFLRFARQNNLSMSQVSVLMHLYYRGSDSILAVRRDLFGTRAAVSQLVEKLVQAGWVERSEAKDDRRVKVLHLTGQGTALVQESIAARQKWLGELSGVFDPADQARFSEMIGVITRAAMELERREAGVELQETDIELH